MRKIYFSMMSLLTLCCIGWSLCVMTVQAEEAKTKNQENSAAQEESISKEKALFDAACNENTIKKYDEYLTQYPDGKFAAEVKLKKEGLVWEGVKKSDYLSTVKNYLTTYPNGQFVSEAQQKLKEIEEKKCGKNADDVITAYEEQYKEWVAPAYNKYKTAQGFDRMMAGLELIASVADIQEVETVWEHCYVEKATQNQKERYAVTFEKVNAVKLELAKLAK